MKSSVSAKSTRESLFSWFRKTAMTKNIRCTSKKNRNTDSDEGSCRKITSLYVHPMLFMPHSAIPNAKSCQNELPNPVSFLEAWTHIAAARKLDTICSEFPIREPSGDVPSHTIAT